MGGRDAIGVRHESPSDYITDDSPTGDLCRVNRQQHEAAGMVQETARLEAAVANQISCVRLRAKRQDNGQCSKDWGCVVVREGVFHSSVIM